MFGKLLKYELRSCMKVFLPIWGAMLALSVVNGFTLNINDDISGTLQFLTIVLPVMLLIFTYAAAFVMALLYVIRRFYTGLLGDEGYLMFTLPVRTSQLVGAKALTALILELVSALMALLGGFLILLICEPQNTANFLAEGFRQFMQLPGGSSRWGWLGLEFLLLVMAGATAENLRIFASIALGHLAQKHRSAWSLVAYVAIGAVLSVLATVCFAGLGSLGVVTSVLENVELTGPNVPAAAMGWMILSQVLVSAAFFFGTNALLTKKLNLE